MARSLVGITDRLARPGETWVVMEATSDHWKPVSYLLEAAGFDAWLLNAKDDGSCPIQRTRPQLRRDVR